MRKVVARPGVLAALFFVTPMLATGLSACKNKPCTGGGKHLNKEPLPEKWGLGKDVPKGNYQCGMDTDPDTSDSRHYEMPGKTPKEALDFWHKLLLSKGYKLKRGDLSSGPVFEREYVYDGPIASSKGAIMSLHVSKLVKGKGWVTISFDQPKKK